MGCTAGVGCRPTRSGTLAGGAGPGRRRGSSGNPGHGRWGQRSAPTRRRSTETRSGQRPASGETPGDVPRPEPWEGVVYALGQPGVVRADHGATTSAPTRPPQDALARLTPPTPLTSPLGSTWSRTPPLRWVMTGHWDRARELLVRVRPLVGGRRSHAAMHALDLLDLLQRGGCDVSPLASTSRRPARVGAPRSTVAQRLLAPRSAREQETWPTCALSWHRHGRRARCSSMTTSCGHAGPPRRTDRGRRRAGRPPRRPPRAPCSPATIAELAGHASASTARWARPGRSTSPPSSTGSTAATRGPP